MTKLFTVAALAASVDGLVTPKSTPKLSLSEHNQTEKSQMWMEKHVCFRKTAVAHNLGRHKKTRRSKQNPDGPDGQPGAGLGEIEPYDTILKDGFMKVACVKDAMYYHGDKFEDNKHDYTMGDRSNVSIIHYDAHVAKEDREQMTPRVCYNFCRTIPHMGFFGLTMGRECYCEPYFDRMAGDSSECDQVCVGDTTQTCGGKKKSDVYEMHLCNDGAQKLATTMLGLTGYKSHLDVLYPKAIEAANGKQELAVEFQEKFGQAGDPEAANLMQVAKQAAGKLLHLAEEAEALSNDCTATVTSARELSGVDIACINDGSDTKADTSTLVSNCLPDTAKVEAFMNYDVAKEGDDLIAKLTELTPKVHDMFEELNSLFLLSEPMVNANFFVESGPCVGDDAGCISTSSDYSYDYYGNKINEYGNSEHCVIQVQGSVDYTVESFDTESGFDFLYINGNEYDGSMLSNGDTGTATGTITWTTDSSSTDPGWKICGTAGGGGDEETEELEEGKQYYPAMYFVDKEFVDMPMTCSGDVIGSPIYYKTYHSCAAACDAYVGATACVGFGYYPTGVGDPNLCFLFSGFKTGQYYTGCDASFLQTKSGRKGNHKGNHTAPLEGEPEHPVCVAKLSKFVGTTLKPNKEGKCDQCFKEVTKANRCYE